MDRNTTVKLAKKLNVTDLSGEKVMVDFESGKYFLIKGVGNDIWDMLGEPITVGEITDRLLSEYEVEENVCLESVINFLTELLKLDFISAE
ncbi:MAG: PqqD family peptide modification chaperone [Lachnospiraceae bacterium]|nr:PqqD family peptide modification chaperone [Lachnospiraceae bacterium]